MNNTMRRVATVVSSLAMFGSVGVLAAAPASAAVKTKCGVHICVNTAHHDTFVQDITVYTRHGGAPRILRAFVGNFHQQSARPTSRFRVIVNRDFPGGAYVCGGAGSSSRPIENVCVRVP